MQAKSSSLKNAVFSILLGALCLGGALGCVSAKGQRRAADVEALPNEPVPHDATTLNACKKWALPVHAHLSHVNVSRNGRQILVSTSADAKHEGRIRLLDGRNGRVLWLRDLEQPVRAQAIAGGGDWLVVNTYDGKLAAYSARGKKLWTAEHLGRPVILSRKRQVVLFNDDDSEPKTAFATYDYGGNLLARVQSEYEPLDMDAASDESVVAITTTDKSLLLYTPDGKPIAQTKLPGDSVAVRVIGGDASTGTGTGTGTSANGNGVEPSHAYVLTSQSRNKTPQTLTAFSLAPGGKDLSESWSVSIDRRYESLRLADGVLFLYGNTQAGQALAAYDANTGVELWHHSYPFAATYSSQVFSKSADGRPFLTVALDDGAQAGFLQLMAIEKSGSARWDAAIEASNGLYSYAFAEDGPALAVGAGEPDNGVVSYYSLRASCTR